MNCNIFVCCHQDYNNKVLTNPSYKLISRNEIKNKSNLELIVHNDKLDQRIWSELSSIHHVFTHEELQTDRIGITHYRRCFDFMNEIPSLHKPIVCQKLHSNYNMLTTYFFYHNAQDLLDLRSIIADKHSDMLQSFDIMLNQNWMYVCNTMVVPKEMFIECWRFVFDCLFEFDKRINVNNSYEAMTSRINNLSSSYLKPCNINDRVEYQARVYGFLSERLVTTFFLNYVRNYGFDSIIEQPYILLEKKYSEYDVI